MQVISGYQKPIGIDPNDTVVFYDDKSNLWASIGLWALEVYGHEDTRLLDGSWVYWEANGLPISTSSEEITKSDYKFTKNPNLNLIIYLKKKIIDII